MKMLTLFTHIILPISEPICAIGLGVAALCCSRQPTSNKWSFANYSMTAVSDEVLIER